jgi:hypothetical protein
MLSTLLLLLLLGVTRVIDASNFSSSSCVKTLRQRCKAGEHPVTWGPVLQQGQRPDDSD